MDERNPDRRVNQELDRLRKQVEEQGHQLEELLHAATELRLRSERLLSLDKRREPPRRI